ncbi:MAG: hypothetical protein ACR2OR_06130 [Hyphomicrobiales bacterium]
MLLAVITAGALAISFVEPIAQPLSYHRFADTRTFLGIVNFNDVASNMAFVIAGAIGLVFVHRSGGRFAAAMKLPYLLFFAGVFFVGFGSAYYHLEPSNARLFWDRLPMAVAFMALVSAIVADRIDEMAGNGWLLYLLVAAGVASLLYWRWSGAVGQGDLRPYIFVQFYPLILLPFILWLFPAYRITRTSYLCWIAGWYFVAKLVEHFDHQIFELLGETVSGHTLKHFAAAGAAFMVLKMLREFETGA